MGAFVLGVLVAWLAEWLFFTFWVKGGSNDSSNCEALRSELRAKNKEISALKSAAQTTSVSKSATSAAKTVSSTATTSTKKVAKKAVTKKAAPKKVTAKSTPKPVTKKSTNTTKAAPRKIAVKKASVAKKPPAKKAVSKGSAGDNLTKLSGIGPSMAATLGELGITTYKKLAAMDDDILRDMLEASGARLNNNKEAMDSWNEQATLADKGDFAGLKKLQDELKSYN